MKTYRFTFEDKSGNDLKSEQVEAKNMLHARRIANEVKANTKINDLHNIRIKPL